MKYVFAFALIFFACSNDPTVTTEGTATSCPPTITLSFTDGTKIDCSSPAMTVSCAANDAACVCKRLTGDAAETACTPCALLFPCTDDCQCVADHGAGWACIAASTGTDGKSWGGCAKQ